MNIFLNGHWVAVRRVGVGELITERMLYSYDYDGGDVSKAYWHPVECSAVGTTCPEYKTFLDPIDPEFDYNEFNMGWLDHPAFKWVHEQQGYYDGVFGARAGPSVCYCLTNLVHEVAHAIKASMDGELWRLRQYDYGLEVKTMVEVLGQTIAEPTTAQITTCEIVVCAIQAKILKSLGYTIDKDWYMHWADTFKYLPDWLSYRPRYKRTSRSIDDREFRQCVRIATKIMNISESLSLDDIKHHWYNVCNYIGNMETYDDCSD